jgi:hypothetical protein
MLYKTLGEPGVLSSINLHSPDSLAFWAADCSAAGVDMGC